MTLEQAEFEKGWTRCRHCGARRPTSAVRTTFVLSGKRLAKLRACRDLAMCDQLGAVRAAAKVAKVAKVAR